MMKFTAEEVSKYVHNCKVEHIPGESGRWSQIFTTIVERDGKFFQLDWDKGLTENQDNTYWEQDAPEVKQVAKVVTIKEWVEVCSDEPKGEVRE